MTGGGQRAGIEGNIPGIAWPPITTGPAATLAALMGQLESSQWLPLETLAAQQFRQMALLAEYCTEHSKLFSARLSRAGLKPSDLGEPESFAKLPLLTRREVQSAGGDLYCDTAPPSHGTVKEVKTSGSTGEPVVVRRTDVNQLIWFAMTLRDHLWHKRDFAGRLCAIRANIPSPVHSETWGMPANLLYRTGPSLGLPISADAKKLVEWVSEFQPDNLLIYPNTLDAFTRHCKDNAVAMPWLRHIRTVGETLSSAIRDAAQSFFGAKIVDCYSSQEIGYIAIECPASRLYHVMSEGMIAELLNDKGEPCREGEIGRVVLTDLHNFATPLVRYDIGDYAEAGPPCPCGRGLTAWKRILGRERNLILMPDGTRHWPLTGFNACRHLAPVSQFQLVQTDRETIEARLVVERKLTSSEEDALRAMLHANTGHPFVLRFVYFEGTLPKGPSGKFEEFVCKAQA